jgi:hypothetical protein
MGTGDGGEVVGEAGGSLPLTDLTSPLVLALHEYWSRLRGPRRWPRKVDFDPTEVRKLLPYLTVEEIHRDPLRVRVRLVGTEQARFAALDYTGRWLHELPWHPKIIQDLLGQYRRLVSLGEPLFGASRYAWNDGFEKVFEWGLFPLSVSGTDIDHVISIEDFSMIDRDRLARLLEHKDRIRARPMAGGMNRPALF